MALLSWKEKNDRIKNVHVSKHTLRNVQYSNENPAVVQTII